MQQLGAKVAEILRELSNLPAFASAGQEARPVGVLQPFVFTSYVFWMLVATLLTALVFVVASRRVTLVPKGLANLVEAAVEFVRDMCVDVIGPQGGRYFPFVATLFFFILFNNVLGLIPGLKSGTATMGVTATLAVMSWAVFVTVGFVRNGFVGYLKSLVPAGIREMGLAWRILLGGYMFVLEFFSTFLVRPLTLAVRLFANIYAGHIILLVFSAFVAIAWARLSVGGVLVGGLSLLMTVLMYAFEVFVAFIQAYVFSILTAVYISIAANAEH